MADRKQTKEILTILVLCLLWYLVSGTNNVIGKMLLSDFPYPMTVTMVQLLSITIYSGPFLSLWGVRKYVDISWKYYLKLIVPLAFGKFFASVFSHLSIWKVPVSYAHTVKATMPLFTVVLSRIILGEKQTMKVYLSLIPIITGVAIASFTELSFDLIGLLSALISTMGFSLQNIFSKKVLHDTGIHHLRLLHMLGRLSLFIFLPVWLFVDFRNVINDSTLTSGEYKVLALLIIDGILNWLQNIIAFSVISLVTPLTYAVASNSKRVFVIGVSLLVLGNPVTWVNIVGMLMAIFGVLCYQKAKYDQRETDKLQTLLPYSQQNWKKTAGYTLLPSNSTDVHLNGFVNHNSHINSNYSPIQNGYAPSATISNGDVRSSNFVYNFSGSNSKMLFV